MKKTASLDLTENLADSWGQIYKGFSGLSHALHNKINMKYLPNDTFSTFNIIKFSFISIKQSNVAFSLLSSILYISNYFVCIMQIIKLIPALLLLVLQCLTLQCHMSQCYQYL